MTRTRILLSLSAKLLALYLVAYTVATVGVVWSTSIRLTRIVNESQQRMYAERLTGITSTLERTMKRLDKTGMADAYRHDFQLMVLDELQATYYSESPTKLYPFILDQNGQGIMIPDGIARLPADFIETYKPAQRQPRYRSFDVNERWYLCDESAAWNWTVCYTVPLTEKYRDVDDFLRVQITALVVAGLAVGLIVVVLLRRFISPLEKLTKVAGKMSKGHYDVPVTVQGNDEVAVLSAGFEKMREAVHSQVQELQLLRNYMSNIIDSMPSMLVGVDEQGLVTQWNIAAAEQMGISTTNAVGQRLESVVPFMANEIYKVKQAISSRQVVSDAGRVRNVGGEHRFEDLTIYPLVANGVQGAVIMIHDVTERVRIEEMIVQSEKMLSVGGLAAGMAHEINNPLAGMIQSAEGLHRRLTVSLPANVKAAEESGITMDGLNRYAKKRRLFEMIDTISSTGRRAADIVGNMLSFARKSSGDFSSTHMDELLEQTIQLAGTDYDLKKDYDFRQIQMRREIEPGVPPVMCERGKIQQVLMNLLRNGAEAMQETATSRPPVFTFRLCHEQQEKMVRLEIEDNGPGIAEAVRKRIFEPFFTTKPTDQGTGLGLSVSYYIITEDHAGSLNVESHRGEFTRFIIRLPVTTEN